MAAVGAAVILLRLALGGNVLLFAAFASDSPLLQRGDSRACLGVGVVSPCAQIKAAAGRDVSPKWGFVFANSCQCQMVGHSSALLRAVTALRNAMGAFLQCFFCS